MLRLAFGLILFATPAIALNKPDPVLTPGAVRTTDKADICSGVSTKDERHVTSVQKRAVFKEYGLVGNDDGWCATNEGCEIDHLISLELGGSNDTKNLWPQPYVGEWNAHQKDVLENRLHKMICAGQISVEDAQHEIATDWIAAYQKLIQGH